MAGLADVDLSAEDVALREMVRALVAEQIAPRAAEVDEQARFPTEALEALAKVDLLGMLVPAEFGGAGGTKLQYAITVEEIARACGSTSATYMTQAHGALPLTLAGTEEQKRRWLPPLAAGEVVGAIALSEPHAGSDLADMRTTAVASADGFVLDGGKMFITNGGQADLVCVFAKTDPSAGHRGISAFLVDGDAAGLSAGAPLKKMGIRGSNTVELFLDSVQVDRTRLLGDPGAGFGLAMRTLEGARLSTAAQALGLGQGAYDIAFAYAQERTQFGVPIYDHQAVQFRLVDMHIALEAARSLLYRTARLMDERSGERHAEATAVAKVHCSDVAMRVATDAVQTLGGYGYMQEYEVERFMRDAKITQIYDGTNDINRLVVGRELARRA